MIGNALPPELVRRQAVEVKRALASHAVPKNGANGVNRRR
jgi:hypothetical protein